ncbi:MAG: DUF502 domain-containing protein [Porticoccaceae bacterium]|jgi:uncharacterized membrane protein|nr:DUF502 domain-containing protein [Porticoccaceae bacterium]MEA3300222.1 DUF502 domain-containing protein [Pseudomonadota bacterium]HLS99564.1 DUF502 domain-containing protein [Porticoccaceae bacterium]
MKRAVKLVLQGLAAVLPLGLTLYFIVWLLTNIEGLARPVVLWLVPDRLYFPGLGVLAALVALFAVGLLVNAYVIRHLIALGERTMESIPLVKSLYGAIRDLMRVFSLAERKDMQSVVAIDIGNDTQLIGFVTGEHAGKRLFPEDKGPRVGVYLPMSYQIGGFTVYVPRERLTPLDIGIEEAMRIAITGGVQGGQPTKEKDSARAR